MKKKETKKIKKNQSNDFFNILSHQLKSPINSIETIIKTVIEGFAGNIDKKSLYFLKKAIKKTNEAREMISDIVSYEKLLSKDDNIKGEIDLITILKISLEKYLIIAIDKNISITTLFPEKIRLFIIGDSLSIELALSNLIENAIKYTPDNGKITIEVGYNSKKQECHFNITDTGSGIQEEDVDLIFNPFFRSIKHKSSISGTGLGLSIVKRIIENYKGKISVKSNFDLGTTFNIIFPLYKTEKIQEKEIVRKKVVIIGGVTAGPKAAARLRRLDENIEITIIEKSEFLSYAGCGLPSYISGKVNSPKALMSTADNTIRDVNYFENIKNIKVLNKSEAIKIDRNQKIIKVKDLVNNKIKDIPYDSLILATGADTLLPKIKGINQAGIYSLHRIEDAETIKKEFLNKKARDLFIIGGGLISIETSESLMNAGARVTILEKKNNILNLFDHDISEKIRFELNSKGIKVITNTNIKEVKRLNDTFMIVTDNKQFHADIIILSTGVYPNSKLAKEAGLELGEAGGIKVDNYFQSTDKSIYAIGDCAESIHLITKKHTYYWPLGSVSTKMGRIVADNICGEKIKFSGHIGTAMFKIFDINVARTGLNTIEAIENGFDMESIVVSGLDRSHYHDNAELIILKILADKKSRVIIGAQGYGKGDVVKRIEILACAISMQMTLYNIFQLDLGYYPAYNNPIDILQTACLVLKSKIEGFCNTISFEELKRESRKVNLIDVSPVTENHDVFFKKSINIPLENLRIEPIPFNKNDMIVLFSKTSARAYEAYRYLIAEGYKKLFILEGGYCFIK